ncbi:MAG TPA: hypothetical protein P5567_03975 [Kiritimatiellia bacterium]|nr:hypothetical protein [Kiritimatiellia bacterium]HRZ11595.1 hypothetical protein [Kiritimatiellia bacterium]HSA16854.1 hypothetical protein [Kiritimatiellia bacterium]
MVAKTEAKPVAENDGDKNEAVVPYALLFVLEDLAVNGRQVLSDALRRHAQESKEKFDDRLFMRHGLTGSPAASLPAILGGDAESQKAVQQRVLDKLAADKAGLNPALASVLKAAAQRRIPALALTSLPEDAARAIAGRLGLEEMGVTLFLVKDAAADFPTPDTWVKAARSIQRRPRGCGALAASGRVARGAVMAGMSCVALPDELTVFEDFGGTALVIETPGDASPSEIIGSLFRQI